MIKRVFLIVIAVSLAAAMSNAAQSKAKLTINPGQVPASDGRQMYASYCASCHGVDGRGHGPAAAALKVSPPDLTVLRKNNGGRFPATHVISILQFGVETPAHGSAEMPVWGTILDKTHSGNIQTKALRLSNLTGYLEKIQAE